MSKPAEKEAVVRHDVKLSWKACATTKNYEPTKRRVPKGKKLPKKRQRPIYSGTWKARKPSEAEAEVEAILKRFAEIRKETELVVARPRKTARG